MNDFYAKIGEHFFHITDQSEISKKIFHRVLKQPVHMEIHIFFGYGQPFKDYEVLAVENENHITYRRADYLIEVDNDFMLAVISVHNELALKHALMNLYSSFIVHHHWGLLIHSSCVVEKGSAHIFAGQSGAGKSTAAKLSYPRNLLSDEATLVRISDDEVTVFDSPFRSELKADGYHGSANLASVQLLYQAQQNNRMKLGKSDAFMQLMDKIFYWPYNREETKTILDLLTKLVKIVPAYELYFQKNNTFWELIS